MCSVVWTQMWKVSSCWLFKYEECLSHYYLSCIHQFYYICFFGTHGKSIFILNILQLREKILYRTDCVSVFKVLKNRLTASCGDILAEPFSTLAATSALSLAHLSDHLLSSVLSSQFFSSVHSSFTWLIWAKCFEPEQRCSGYFFWILSLTPSKIAFSGMMLSAQHVDGAHLGMTFKSATKILYS